MVAAQRPAAVLIPRRSGKALSTGLDAFENLDSLLNSDIEVVLISSPTSMHAEHLLSRLPPASM